MRRLHGSVLWAALLTGAGCGGRASDVALDLEEPPTLPPSSTVPFPMAPMPGSVRPGRGGSASSGGGSSTGGRIDIDAPPTVRPPGGGPPPPTAPARAAALVALSTFCGDCHGERAIEAGNVQGGIDYIEDIDRLVVEGWIIPLRSAESPLLQIVSEGRMPPPGVEPRPTSDDILTLRRFIDDPRRWPYDPPSVGDAGAPASDDAGSPAPSDAGASG